MRSTIRAAIASLLLGVAAGCGIVTSVHPHVRSTSGPAPGASEPPPSATLPGADPSPGAPTVGAARGTRSPEERVVCRASTPPSGWIAVAYVGAPEQSPPVLSLLPRRPRWISGLAEP